MTGVFRPIPRPVQPRRHLSPAQPQLVVVAFAGASQPGSTVAAATVVRTGLAGSSSPTGLVTRTPTRAGLAGTASSSGTVTPTKVSVLGTRTGSGISTGTLLPRTVGKPFAGQTAPAGASMGRSISRKTLTGAGGPTATMFPARILVRGTDGAAAPTGLLRRVPVKPGAGAGSASGSIVAPRFVTHRLGSTSTPTGSMTPTRAPATGTRTSPPRAIPDGPLAGSRVIWAATLNGGTVLVKTSVDNGATFQTVARSGDPIPRLAIGDTRTNRTVLTQFTLTRASPADPSPVMHRIGPEFAVNAHRDELVPLGLFRLSEAIAVDGPGGSWLELAGADLASKVSRAKWTSVYVIAEGTNYGTAIRDLLTNRVPSLVFNFVSTDRLTPSLFFGEQDTDPWADAQSMAASIGCELYFDPRGVCVMRPVPDPEITDPVWMFDDDAEPTITDLRRVLTSEPTRNMIIVTGENTGVSDPVRAVALDDDPASATYYLNDEGIAPLRITTPLVTSLEQGQDYADAELRRRKGLAESVEMTVVTVPMLEPGDISTLTRDRVRVEGRYLTDGFTIDVNPEVSMRIVARRQRI